MDLSFSYVCGMQRWAESEKLTQNPDPKTKTPHPTRAHLCHAT